MPRSNTAALELADARQQGLLNIGQAAAVSGVSAKMIRHYESIGLIPEAGRTFSNYRLYSHNDVRLLQFVRRARSLGFSLPEIKDLLALWQDRHRKSADVRRIALEHVRELDVRVAELQSMRRTLQQLAATCHGDERPECPILDDLASPEGRPELVPAGRRRPAGRHRAPSPARASSDGTT